MEILLFLEIMQKLGHIWRLRSKVHILLLVILSRCPASCDSLTSPCAGTTGTIEVSEPGKGWHQLWITGKRSLLEVGRLKTLVRGGSLGRVIPETRKIEKYVRRLDLISLT